MLEFLRRYQRVFFIVITFVIVISFSFFGTFQTFSNREGEDKVAFTAVDGTKVLRSELNDMVNFLSSDSHDIVYSSSGAGNALNDGVVANDILESGLAQVIAQPYIAEIGEELQPRLEREKRYATYKHPKAPFLTAEQIWSYYAPDIKSNFDRLRSFDSAKNSEAFTTRINLYIAERNFPQAYLKQFLRFQESSHKWVPQDPNLAYQDLSLFNYHSTQDWFGRQFIELTAQYIINSAKIATQKGYKVTKEEVLGSLFRNTESAFRESRTQGTSRATNVGDFFSEQLRRLGMDQSRAVKVWTQVLLFRTLFFDNGDSVLVDTSSYKNFYNHLNEYVDIDLYQLPKPFRFANLRDLEQFSLYLTAVRPPSFESAAKQNPLAMPKNFAPASEVKKSYPELVERTFLVRYAQINKEQLQPKIGVKNTWEWQVADQNWQKLKERYQALASGKDSTTEERLSLLDHLEPSVRSMADSYSRMQIVDEHPEWISQALQDAPMKEEEVHLRDAGGKMPFTGIKNSSELIQLLDSAPLNEAQGELSSYSQDGTHYLRIEVLDRSKPERVLTFEQAKQDGTLSKLLDKVLEASYPKLRSKQTAAFAKENGEWKPFSEVKEDVALIYFDDLFKYLNQQIAALKVALPDFTDWSDNQKACLVVSLLPLVREKQQEVSQTLTAGGNGASSSGICASEEQEANESAEEKVALTGPDQCNLSMQRERLTRKDSTFPINPELAFSLDKGALSPLSSYQNSGPCFFVVRDKGFLSASDMVRQKVNQEREMLGREAVENLGQLLLVEMQKKGAIELDIKSEPAAQKASSAESESDDGSKG